jgi:hypothetical protein
MNAHGQGVAAYACPAQGTPKPRVRDFFDAGRPKEKRTTFDRWTTLPRWTPNATNVNDWARPGHTGTTVAVPLQRTSEVRGSSAVQSDNLYLLISAVRGEPDAVAHAGGEEKTGPRGACGESTLSLLLLFSSGSKPRIRDDHKVEA